MVLFRWIKRLFSCGDIPINIDEVETSLGYHFNDPNYLFKSLKHRSYSQAVDGNTDLSNEVPPDLEILSDQVINGERQVTTKIHTKQSADQIRVYLPVNGLRSIEVHNRQFLTTANSDNTGTFRFTCYGMSCDGLKMTIHLEPEKPYLRLMVQGGRHWDLPMGWVASLEEHLEAS